MTRVLAGKGAQSVPSPCAPIPARLQGLGLCPWSRNATSLCVGTLPRAFVRHFPRPDSDVVRHTLTHCVSARCCCRSHAESRELRSVGARVHGFGVPGIGPGASPGRSRYRRCHFHEVMGMRRDCRRQRGGTGSCSLSFAEHHSTNCLPRRPSCRWTFSCPAASHFPGCSLPS